MSTYFQCPNCDSNWGIEEIDFQECDSCGWPEPEPEIDSDDIDDEYFEEGVAG